MSKQMTTKKRTIHGENAGLISYIVGFVLSVVLTLIAYYAVVMHADSEHKTFGHTAITIFIVVLAFVQLLVQLVFFLHLAREEKPRLNTNALLFAVLIIAILVIGSLWIMENLSYSHPDVLSPDEFDNYIMEKEAIYK